MAAQPRRKLAAVGSRAPAFRLARLEGGEATLAELISRGPVLLAFFKTSCPVCQLTLPYLERLHASGVVPVYAVSQNDPDDTREFNGHFGINLPTLLDDEEAGFPASNAFGISTVPTLFFVGPEGVISRVIEGWQKAEIEWLGLQAGVAPFREGEKVPEWKPG